MFDPRCLELAEVFLEDSVADTPDHRQSLAQTIQDAIEGAMTGWEDELRDSREAQR